VQGKANERNNNAFFIIALVLLLLLLLFPWKSHAQNVGFLQATNIE